MENQKDEFYEWMDNHVHWSQDGDLASENFLNEEWESPVNFELPEWGGFFKGLPEYVPYSQCGGEKCIIPVSAKEQCIAAPSPQQKKRLTLTVRVNMPRFGIHNVDSMVEVNGSEKVIVLREKLRDIARTKRMKFPLNECFFIHLQDGIHTPLDNPKLSFEKAGVIRNGSIILAVSPSVPLFLLFLHPDTQLHRQDCAPSSKKS